MSWASADPAPITSVVVFADRAQVTRSQVVDCGAGQARFSGLPSTLRTETLWATLSGKEGSVQGLTHREETTGPQPEARALQNRIRTLDEQMSSADDEVSAARSTERKLESFVKHLKRVWGIQAAGKAPPVPAWDAALDLLRQQARAAADRQRRAHTRMRELRRERSRLERDLQAMERKRRRTTLAVTALLKCSGRRTVKLTYVVPGATWQMTYELRAHEDRGQVELVAGAMVQQGSGEDWSDVALAVSTANLQRSNIPPKIGKMNVSTSEPTDTRKVLTRRTEHRRHLTTARKEAPATPVAEAEARPSGPLPGQEPGLAMELAAAGRITVSSDGRKVLVELARRQAAARLSYETVPKLFPHVYRKLELDNPFKFTMLPGPVEIFRGRSFWGRAQVKVRAPREPIAFSLGVENQLQVARYTKKEKLEPGGALSSTQKLLHRYVVTVGNWTPRPQRVRVLENIPVSQVKEIKVALSDKTTRPSRKNDTDGILTWELEIPARAKRKLELEYTVTLPKAYEVTGYD